MQKPSRPSESLARAITNALDEVRNNTNKHTIAQRSTVDLIRDYYYWLGVLDTIVNMAGLLDDKNIQNEASDVFLATTRIFLNEIIKRIISHRSTEIKLK